jgi:hypothetical protein
VASDTYRHSFVSDALENGVGAAQVAELPGNASTDMVADAPCSPDDEVGIAEPVMDRA